MYKEKYLTGDEVIFHNIQAGDEDEDEILVILGYLKINNNLKNLHLQIYFKS